MKSSYLLSTLVALGVFNIALPASAQEALSAMCNNERAMVEEINTQGVGDRFTIPTAWAIQNSGAIRFTIEEVSSSSSLIQTECPDDQVESNPMAGGLIPIEWWGHGSIVRFKGTQILNGVTFSGDENEPLAFIFLQDYGMVYLHGTGRVIQPNGEEITFSGNP